MIDAKEIVQALRCCAEGECKDCAMHEDKQRCQENLLDKASEAIERLNRLPLFVPHRRIAEVAAELGLSNVVLTGPADTGILESLCSYPWPRHERLS